MTRPISGSDGLPRACIPSGPPERTRPPVTAPQPIAEGFWRGSCVGCRCRRLGPAPPRRRTGPVGPDTALGASASGGPGPAAFFLGHPLCGPWPVAFFFVLLSLPHPAAVRPDAVERVAPGAGFRAKLHRIPAVRAAVPARCPVDLHKRPPPFSHGHIPAGMLGELLLKTVHGGPLLPPPVGCGGAVRLSTVPNLRTPRDTPSIPGSPGRRSD